MALSKLQFSVVDDKGNVVPGASVVISNEDTGGAVLLYSDRAGLSPISNPVTADAYGLVSVFAEPGVHRIRATAPGFSADWRYVETGALELLRRNSQVNRLYSTLASAVTGPDGNTIPANTLAYFAATNEVRFVIGADGRFAFNTPISSMDTAYKLGPTDNLEDTRLTLYCVTNGTRADITLSSASYHATFAHGTPLTAVIGENWGIAWGVNPAGANGGYALVGDHNNYVGINVGVGAATVVPPFPLPLVVGYKAGMSVFSGPATAGFFKDGAAYIITHNETADIEMVFGDNALSGVLGTVSGHALLFKVSGVDYTSVDVSGHWNFGANGTSKNLSGIAALTCTSVRINQAATTAAIAQAHWTAININGTSYKLLLGT